MAAPETLCQVGVEPSESIAIGPAPCDHCADAGDRDAGLRRHHRQCRTAAARAQPGRRHRSRFLGHDELSVRVCGNGDDDRLVSTPLGRAAGVYRSRSRCSLSPPRSARVARSAHCADFLSADPGCRGRRHSAFVTGDPSRHLPQAGTRPHAGHVGSDDHGRADAGPGAWRRHHRSSLLAMDLRCQCADRCGRGFRIKRSPVACRAERWRTESTGSELPCSSSRWLRFN